MKTFINPVNNYASDDVLLTTQQACRVLSLTRQTLQRLADRRSITRFKLSNSCVRYSQKSITAFLNREGLN